MERLERWRFLRFGWVAVLALGLLAGCDGGGGGGGSADVGDNDANTVLCLGDSITQGRCAPAGAPYPSRLADLSGKNVVNAGVCGERIESTAARAPGLLAKNKPGYLCVLIGANDASFGTDAFGFGEDLRGIIQAAKAQKTVVLVGTITPTVGPHAYSNGGVDDLNAVIRQVVKEEGAKLVDINKEFGGDPALLQDDGLHPNDAGTQLIALAFNDRI